MSGSRQTSQNERRYMVKSWILPSLSLFSKFFRRRKTNCSIKIRTEFWRKRNLVKHIATGFSKDFIYEERSQRGPYGLLCACNQKGFIIAKWLSEPNARKSFRLFLPLETSVYLGTWLSGLCNLLIRVLADCSHRTHENRSRSDSEHIRELTWGVRSMSC